jgi:hypothetical protein
MHAVWQAHHPTMGDNTVKQSLIMHLLGSSTSLPKTSSFLVVLSSSTNFIY